MTVADRPIAAETVVTPRLVDRAAVALTLLTAFAFIAWAAFRLRNTFYGDPSIYLPYAQNMANGDFFSFNPGEFSSGSTSPIWALILSPAYLLPGEPAYTAKAIAAAAVAMAAASLFWMTRTASRSPIGAAVATAALLYFLTEPGLLMYESPLAVFLVSLLVLVTCRTMSDATLSTRRLIQLGILWALLPLARPEALLISAISFAHFAILHRRTKGSFSRLAAAGVLALVPLAAYWGYSVLQTGCWSASSECRTFSLRERAPHLWGMAYSTALFDVLRTWPVMIWLALAAWGYGTCLHNPQRRLLATTALIVLATYALLLTVVSPAGGVSDTRRYLLPAIPFLLALISAGAAHLWKMRPRAGTVLILIPAAYLLVWAPLRDVRSRVINEARHGFTLDKILERDLVDHLNHTLEPGATVLAYEVQIREGLRPDLRLLSLDGITDGKVEPYLHSADMAAFLRRYKPDYWLANDAVFYRPYLRRSILKEVVDQTGERQGQSTEIQGIRFTNIRNRTEPLVPGFAGYRHLYRLSYR